MKIHLFYVPLSLSLLILSCQGRGLSQENGTVQESKKPRYLQVGRGTKPFDVTRHSIEIDDILLGGPPRDGIPALEDPKFVTPEEAKRFMHGRDEILGLVENGVAKAYPLKILTHHEVVNDHIGGRPIAVTY